MREAILDVGVAVVSTPLAAVDIDVADNIVVVVD